MIDEYKPVSLKVKLVALVITCWLLPMAIVFAMLAYDLTQNYRTRIHKEFSTTVTQGVEIASLHLDQIVEASREASRQPFIRDAYASFTENEYLSGLSEQTNQFLNRYFKYDNKSMMALICYPEIEHEPFFTFNSRAGGEIERFNYYIQNVHADTMRLSEDLDTRIGFIGHEGRVYMVRNIVNSDFDTYAIIVIELNVDYVFAVFHQSGWFNGFRFTLNGMVYDSPDSSISETKMDAITRNRVLSKSVQIQDLLFYGKKSDGSVKITFFVEIDSFAINELLSDFPALLMVFMMLLTGLVIWLIYASYKNVFTPITLLIKAAKTIESGAYGYQIEEDFGNEEFFQLRDSVNHMSGKLKTQFEQIYSEELALRDARIMALQSQINPHFLNNTLEIINWEARLQGQDNISRMLESLSTMLHATTDRNDRPLITLQNELDYVESYLFIVKERFGDRLEIERHIRPDTLGIRVPRLILQPIIENAIEHGMPPNHVCEITIQGLVENDALRLRITNNSPLQEENRRAITALLSGDKSDEQYKTRMGIYNVSARLKIIYGEKAGLFICDDGKNTTAEIVIPLSHDSE